MTAPPKRVLGRTGIQVSELGFGAWQIGGVQYGPVAESEAVEIIHRYIQAGGNLIDTARAYGASEAILGKVLSREKLRERVVLATKTQKGSDAQSIPAIREDLEESLRLLKTDCVDLYYLHQPPDDPAVMHQAIDLLESLKREGKLKAIGASVKGPAVTDATVKLCRQYIDSGRIDALQVVYSILRQKNAAIFDDARRKGVGIVVRTAIESGFLSGKYRPGQTISEGHRKRWTPETQSLMFQKVLEMESYALRPPYPSMAEVAVRFSLEPPGVSSVIVGARTPEQMQKNLAIVSLPPLPSEIRARLEKEFGGMTEEFNPV
ncbi:MAG TPA: aldo/keto reductase [Thermodesulfobacteriota bacterium]|nr:aldo/keto reductase [Thermodesulfobacteriota bacterium]